ncbi:MAG: tetratricopeptide repeat protein, partial [Calditrichota bacterium]
IALSDSSAVYLNNLAYTYSVRGINLKKALELSSRAVAIEPENGAYLDTMGWIEYGLGNYRVALRWLRKALKTTSDSATTLEHIGDVYIKLGSESKAIKFYRQALELNPENEELQLKISR